MMGGSSPERTPGTTSMAASAARRTNLRARALNIRVEPPVAATLRWNRVSVRSGAHISPPSWPMAYRGRLAFSPAHAAEDARLFLPYSQLVPWVTAHGLDLPMAQILLGEGRQTPQEKANGRSRPEGGGSHATTHVGGGSLYSDRSGGHRPGPSNSLHGFRGLQGGREHQRPERLGRLESSVRSAGRE